MVSEKKTLSLRLLWAALTNGYLAGFLNGKIYRGTLKNICVPGLNCYSCPGALGACPVGSFQSMLTGLEPRFPYYVLGFLFAFGAIFGRFVCGWLCPFALVQDLLYKIPLFRKRKNLPFDRALRFLKYLVLFAFVIAFPLFLRDEIGMSDPWFCKYICPSGTFFGGWVLALNDGAVRGALGGLFAMKSAILIALLLISIKFFRPFCKYLCPLGAFYGFFNKIAIFRLALDKTKCLDCGACSAACPMVVAMPQKLNSAECVHCGRCADACKVGAIRLVSSLTKPMTKEMIRRRTS